LVVNEYERAQFELILLEYKARGFDVSLEPEFGEIRVDAIARRDRETIVVELVNSSENVRQRETRTDGLQRLFDQFPEWKLDLRYIDNPQLDSQRATVGVGKSWGILAKRSGPNQVLAELKTRRRTLSMEASHSPEYLRVWSYLAQTLRFWERRKFGPQEMRGISETWTTFSEMNAEMLGTIDDLLDFSQLEDYARIAIEGGIVEKSTTDDLWKTYLRVRRIVLNQFSDKR
jgi:hypothetical protein